MTTDRRQIGLAILVTAWLSLAGSPTSLQAQVVCGAMITGDAVMGGDLNCPANDPAVQVNGGSLDMNGHRISGCLGTGILVTGAGSKVSNGSVRGCVIGVDLDTTVGAKLTNVTAAVNSSHGFRLSNGTGNKLIACTALGNGGNGFYQLSTDESSYKRCVSSDNTMAGFQLEGNGNQVRDSVIVDNAGPGMDVIGDSNNFSRNVLTDNLTGLSLSGTGKVADNRVTQSTSQGFGLVNSGSVAKLSKNVAADNGTVGFSVGGTAVMKNNTATQNGGTGFVVTFADTTLNSCIASNNTSEGFLLTASASAITLNGSAAMRNGGNGVRLAMGASGNEVVKNVSIESGDDDLQDDNMNCGSNVWNNNVFRTSEAAAVPMHICIQ